MENEVREVLEGKVSVISGLRNGTQSFGVHRTGNSGKTTVENMRRK